MMDESSPYQSICQGFSRLIQLWEITLDKTVDMITQLQNIIRQQQESSSTDVEENRRESSIDERPSNSRSFPSAQGATPVSDRPGFSSLRNVLQAPSQATDSFPDRSPSTQDIQERSPSRGNQDEIQSPQRVVSSRRVRRQGPTLSTTRDNIRLISHFIDALNKIKGKTAEAFADGNRNSDEYIKHSERLQDIVNKLIESGLIQ
jgi:hypothetical protein